MSRQYHEQVSVCILCIALTDERDWWGGRGLDSGGGEITRPKNQIISSPTSSPFIPLSP